MRVMAALEVEGGEVETTRHVFDITLYLKPAEVGPLLMAEIINTTLDTIYS